MEMGTLSLTNLNQKIKTSDKLFYNQFHYCFKIHFPHCGALNGIFDHGRIDEILDLRENLWHRSRNINFGGSWRTAKVHKVTDEIRRVLHRACSYFQQFGSSIRLNILQDWIYLYTNQYTMREDLLDIGFTIDSITTVKLNRPFDTVKSNHKTGEVRCYFKQTELTETEKELIFKFLNDNVDEVRPSLGVQYFGARQDLHLRTYFFIDFNDEKLISVLELMTPNLIRKIQPIFKK